jgi:hypothetical protein
MSAHPSEQSPRCLVCGQLLASGLDAEIIRLRALNADMLAALCDLHDAVKSGGYPHAAMNAASAAIAKAKGETG